MLLLQNLMVFKIIVGDIFKGLPDSTAQMRTTSAVLHAQDLDTALLNAAEEARLIPHKPWLEKCTQLNTLAQVHQGRLMSIIAYYIWKINVCVLTALLHKRCRCVYNLVILTIQGHLVPVPFCRY